MRVRKPVLFLFLVFAASSLLAMDIDKLPPDNWAAPATWSPARSHSGLSTQDVTNPLPFIGLAPCRIVDTRGGAPITGGIFTGGADVRTYNLAGICGVPAHARAVSLNFTVTGPGQTTPGFLLAWPTGGAVPPVSILNWDHVQAQIANAAVVPTGSGNLVAITVNVSAPTHVIIDVNGFYYDGLSDFQSGTTLPAGEQFIVVANSAGASGLYGQNINSTTDSRGIRGLASASTGTVYGVWGQTFSTGTRAAGVLATDGAGAANNTADFAFSTGLIAEGRNGVVAHTSTLFGYGVFGAAENGTGAVLGEGVLGVTGIFGGTHGVWAFVGDIGCSSCTKAFVDPHPTDPSKEIRFAALEGNEAGTYFRGTAETVGREFVIQVPEEFRMVTDSEGLTVQLTPVGAPASMYVVSEDLNQIVVRSSKDVKFHYLVQGIRPAYKDYKAVQEMSAYLPQSANGRMPEGWSEWTKQRLIANGTYNADGTINKETAERVGWAAMWRAQEEEMKAQAAAAKARGDAAYPK